MSGSEAAYILLWLAFPLLLLLGVMIWFKEK